jgi:NADPH:quinone reductase-like Zn-dependent oxidoreductase
MKRLVVKAPGKDVASCQIETEEVPVPEPGAGQVLIKVTAAAINPSDYGSWPNCRPEQCPFAMGKEGCGVVVKTGSGILTSLICGVGTKVGFSNLQNKQGSYSEFVVADAYTSVFRMPNDLPIEDAASFFVNPYTAIGILDTVKSEGSKAFVHTAAASQLGQMLIKVAPSQNVEIICVVRRQDQADLLRNIGAKHIVVTGKDDSWKQKLKAKIDELNATVACDAVAGRSAGDLLDLMPVKGTVYVYGGLAGKVENVNPMALIYHEKKLKGFFLTAWIQHGGMLATIPRMMMAGHKVNTGLSGGWSSSKFKDTSLENVQSDIVQMLNSSVTGQKLRVRLDS